MSIRRQRRASVRAEPAESIRILADLRERGIAGDVHEAFVDHLASVWASGSLEVYRAALDAVELAYRRGGAVAAGSLHEFEQLMIGFGEELQKLEEALQTLDAYVRRMRSLAGLPAGQRLH